MENSSRVNFSDGRGGLPKIDVRTTSSDAEIYLNGAHVTHFQRKGDTPLLFLSEQSKFQSGHPIRGGVPIIFPWFGAREGKSMHGFARTQTWELKEISCSEGAVTLQLSLPESPESAEFPKFTVEYFISVAKTLMLELKITNCSRENLSFEDCLHTYFSVEDITAVRVTGLNGAGYLDKVGTVARRNEANDQISISRETDRVYLNTTSAVEIHDSKLRRKIIVEKSGSRSTVLWNPWIAKSKAMADFGDEEYLKMLCVESGNVSQNKLILSPGQTSSLKVNLSAERI